MIFVAHLLAKAIERASRPHIVRRDGQWHCGTPKERGCCRPQGYAVATGSTASDAYRAWERLPPAPGYEEQDPPWALLVIGLVVIIVGLVFGIVALASWLAGPSTAGIILP